MFPKRVVHAREAVAGVVQRVERRGVIALQRIAARFEEVVVRVGQHGSKQHDQQQGRNQGHAAHAQPVGFAGSRTHAGKQRAGHPTRIRLVIKKHGNWSATDGPGFHSFQNYGSIGECAWGGAKAEGAVGLNEVETRPFASYR